MHVVENARPQTRGHFLAGRFRHAEPAHEDAVHLFGAGLVGVRPRRVAARARREHFHFRVLDQMFGDVAGVKLAAAVYGRAVTLNDDRQFHGVSGSPAEPPVSGSSGPSSGPSNSFTGLSTWLMAGASSACAFCGMPEDAADSSPPPGEFAGFGWPG